MFKTGWKSPPPAANGQEIKSSESGNSLRVGKYLLRSFGNSPYVNSHTFGALQFPLLLPPANTRITVIQPKFTKTVCPREVYVGISIHYVTSAHGTLYTVFSVRHTTC